MEILNIEAPDEKIPKISVVLQTGSKNYISKKSFTDSEQASKIEIN